MSVRLALSRSHWVSNSGRELDAQMLFRRILILLLSFAGACDMAQFTERGRSPKELRDPRRLPASILNLIAASAGGVAHISATCSPYTVADGHPYRDASTTGGFEYRINGGAWVPVNVAADFTVSFSIDLTDSTQFLEAHAKHVNYGWWEPGEPPITSLTLSPGSTDTVPSRLSIGGLSFDADAGQWTAWFRFFVADQPLGAETEVVSNAAWTGGSPIYGLTRSALDVYASSGVTPTFDPGAFPGPSTYVEGKGWPITWPSIASQVWHLHLETVKAQLTYSPTAVAPASLDITVGPAPSAPPSEPGYSVDSVSIAVTDESTDEFTITYAITGSPDHVDVSWSSPSVDGGAAQSLGDVASPATFNNSTLAPHTGGGTTRSVTATITLYDGSNNPLASDSSDTLTFDGDLAA